MHKEFSSLQYMQIQLVQIQCITLSAQQRMVQQHQLHLSQNIVEEVAIDDENYEIWSSKKVIMVAYINSYQLNLPVQDTRLA